MSEHDDYDPHHESSPTDHLIQDLQLHGYRPSEDELDQRPPPEDRIIEGAVADIFDALVATITDTSLDFDLPDLLWSTVNMFHRAVDRIETSPRAILPQSVPARGRPRVPGRGTRRGSPRLPRRPRHARHGDRSAARDWSAT